MLIKLQEDQSKLIRKTLANTFAKFLHFVHVTACRELRTTFAFFCDTYYKEDFKKDLKYAGSASHFESELP